MVDADVWYYFYLLFHMAVSGLLQYEVVFVLVPY